LGDSNPFDLKENDDIENLESFERFTGVKASQSERSSRASVRVTTADTLPLLGEIEESLWVLTGLGSRGFVFAPLLAEVR